MPDALPAPEPNIPDILRRYVNGESIQVLAREHAVNRQTIYNWMLAETGHEYEQVITRALVNRIADADAQLENSSDALGITRARELARFSRMDFERRRPKLYGPKQEVTSDNTIRVIIQPPPPVIDVKARRIKELEESNTHAPHEGAIGQGSNEKDK